MTAPVEGSIGKSGLDSKEKLVKLSDVKNTEGLIVNSKEQDQVMPGQKTDKEKTDITYRSTAESNVAAYNTDGEYSECYYICYNNYSGTDTREFTINKANKVLAFTETSMR